MKSGSYTAWYEIEDGTVQSERFCDGELAHFSQRCPSRVNSPNEDAACVVQFDGNNGLIAVADGVGGAHAGNIASRIAIEKLISSTTADSGSSQRRGQILDAIEAANTEILKRGRGSGTTLVVVEYSDGFVRTFHTGDSRAVLLSNRGRLKYATVGHAPVAMQVAIGLLEEGEALMHDERNLISNCVGSREMKIEIGPVLPMAARDTLLLASDGLFDNLITDEVVELIRTGELSRRTSELAGRVTSRMTMADDADGFAGKPDDLTMISFRRKV